MDPNELVEVYVLRNPGRVAALKLLLKQRLKLRVLQSLRALQSSSSAITTS